MANKPRSQDNKDFDADAKTRALKDATYTIAGKTYHPVVKDNAVSRQAEEIGWEQEKCNAEAEVAREELVGRLERDEATGQVVQVGGLKGQERLDRWDELSEKIRTAEAAAREKNIAVCVLMLEGEDGEKPDPADFESLTPEVVGEMTTRLLAGGEPLEGPTATPAS